MAERNVSGTEPINEPPASREPVEAEDEAAPDPKLKQELSLKYVLDYLSVSAEEAHLLGELCVFIPFLIMFLFYGFLRRDTMEEHFAASGLKRLLAETEIPPTRYHVGAIRDEGPDFAKTFMECDSEEDVYNWLEGVVIPTMYDPEHNASIPSRLGPVGGNVAIGTVRVRSLRVKENSCTANHEFYDSQYPKACYGRYSHGNEYKGPYGDETSGIVFQYTEGCKYPWQYVVGEYATYPCGGYILDIPLNNSFKSALTIARTLRLGNYLNVTWTRFMEVEVFTYNPDLDSFVSGKLLMEITEMGGWIQSNRFRSFKVYTTHGMGAGYIVYDFFFFAFVLYFVYRFFASWYRHGKKTGKPWSYFFQFWTFLNMINLLCFLTSFGLHWEWWRASLQVDIKIPMMNEYPERLNYVMEVYYIFIYINAANTVLTFLQLLRYMRMHSRLSILTRTLAASAQNLIGVVIIFTLIVTAYALTGTSLYGTSVASFRSVATSFSTLFLLLLTNFNYGDMREVNPSITFLFFWSYVIIALFVMLNFIVAILGNGFEDEQEKTKPLPVDMQVRRTVRRLKNTNVASLFQSFLQYFLHIRRMPGEVLRDYLVDYRKSLLVKDNISEEGIMDGDVPEPEYTMTRGTLDEIVPKAERDSITEGVLDIMWIEMAEDWELMYSNEDEDEEEDVVEKYGEFAEKILPEVLEKRVKEVSERREREKTSESMQPLRRADLMSAVRRSTTSSEGVEHLARSIHTLEETANSIADLAYVVAYKIASLPHA